MLHMLHMLAAGCAIWGEVLTGADGLLTAWYSAQGITVHPPVKHTWVRGGAWQMGCDDKILRAEAKGGHEGDLVKLHAWLTKHNTSGVISRQEIASMIPVALLGINAGDEVLDLCASPGSKTTQVMPAKRSLMSPGCTSTRTVITGIRTVH